MKSRFALKVYLVEYTHTTKTLGGDVDRSGILSIWTTRKGAEQAESEAWSEYGWGDTKHTKTTTSIRERDVFELLQTFVPANP